MDFASLMKSQIGSATKPTSTSTSDNNNTGGANKKYLKRSEIEAARQATYAREQAALEQARLDRVEKKRQREEDEAERNAVREAKKRRLAEESRKVKEAEEEREEAARRKRLGLPELVKAKDGEEEEGADGRGEEDVSDEELREKLRVLGEPRVLFGETHTQRLRRYRKLTDTVVAAPPVVMSKGPIPTTLELVPEKDMKVPTSVPQDAPGRQYLLRQLASYFDMVLSEWSLALSRRPTAVKESYAGKQAYASFAAARDNLRPLFRKFEKPTPATFPDTLLAPILEIVHLAQQKRYVHANDAYLRCSIGKAAWPIGVTMVGIHERSAREKLHETGEKNRAHILADETTRKMLQGIKRCLSFAQTRWPPEDVGQLMG